MHKIEQKVTVPYTIEQMFSLVDDILSYPKFLPGCSSAVVLSRAPDEVKATLKIAKGLASYSFSTVNKLHPHERIQMNLLEGPFSHLNGEWRFIPLSNGNTEVHFSLQFEFSSRILSNLFGIVFNKVAHSFVQAFCDRAKQLYG